MLILLTYTLKPGCREDFFAAVHELGMPQVVQQEDGCLRYDYFLSPDQPDQVLLIEEWASEKHQQAHMETPHMKAFLRLKPDFVLSANGKTY